MIPATSQSTTCSMLDQDDHHMTGVRTDRSTPRRTLDRYAARTDEAEPQHALRRLCNHGCWLAERGWVIYLRMEEGHGAPTWTVLAVSLCGHAHRGWILVRLPWRPEAVWCARWHGTIRRGGPNFFAD